MKLLLLLIVLVILQSISNGYKVSSMRRFLNMNSNQISPLSQQEYNQKNIMNAMILTTIPIVITTTNPHKAMSAILSAEERQLQQNQKPDALSGIPQYTGVKPDWKKMQNDISELIKARPEKGPTLVRLAWHSSGTYDKMTNSGGSGKGTIRFKEELGHGANAGLDNAINWLEPIYKKYSANSDLSYADLYTFAGAVAIKTLGCHHYYHYYHHHYPHYHVGGPTIKWQAGRVDSYDEKDATPDGRLPDADKGNPMKTAEGLRKVFNRMGFNDQEIVALSGAHALGRCHVTASGT